MSSSARDVVYGRRGGGWADKPTARAQHRRKASDYRPCAACAEAVPIIGLPPTTDLDRVTCAAMRCRARVEWTPADWEGRARMAEARRAAGITLTGLDLEALDRKARP